MSAKYIQLVFNDKISHFCTNSFNKKKLKTNFAYNLNIFRVYYYHTEEFFSRTQSLTHLMRFK